MIGSSIFPAVMRREISFDRSSRLVVISRAVFTWGMPLRSLPGKKRKVSQAVRLNPSGAMTKLNQG